MSCSSPTSTTTCASSTGSWGGGPQPSSAIDVVVLAGDLLDIAVVRAVGHADHRRPQLPRAARAARAADVGLLGQPRPRPPHRVRREGHPLARRGPPSTASAWTATRFDLDGWALDRPARGGRARTPSPTSKPGSQRAAADRPDRWLWAFHGPPDGPLSWTGTRHYGDPELPRLLDAYRPDVVLCGPAVGSSSRASGSVGDDGWARYSTPASRRSPADLHRDRLRRRPGALVVIGSTKGEID